MKMRLSKDYDDGYHVILKDQWYETEEITGKSASEIMEDFKEYGIQLKR